MSLYGTSNAFGKDVWIPSLNYELLDEPGTLLNFLGGPVASDNVTVEGRRAYAKLRVGDSLGQMTIAESGSYASPGDPTYDEATFSLAHLSHAVDFTMEEMALLESGAAAAAPVMAEKLAAAKDAMAMDIERQAWMDGTGVLANVASSSGATITLDATTTSQIDRDRYIWIDDANRMRYQVVHGTTGAIQEDSFTVSDIAESTNILTCSSADMTSATSAGVVVRDGGSSGWATGGAFRSLEFTGLLGAISDTGTYLGINRATAGKGFWKAVKSSNLGTLRTLTEDLCHTIINQYARRNGRQPNSTEYGAFASPGTWTAYHQIMSPALRYSLSDSPDIGFGKPLEFFGLPLYKAVRCPRNGIFGVKKSSMKFVRPKHDKPGDLLNWVTLGGSQFFLANASSGGGHAARVLSYLDGFLGMATLRPRDHFYLADITEVGSAY